jgi:hypothetical protein
LDDIRPATAKAGLHRTGESEAVGSSDPLGLGDVIKHAALQHFGSVKALAITLDVDPSLMQREFADGKFGRLFARIDTTAQAAIADALARAYGPLLNPKDRARRLIHAIEGNLAELKQFIEVA